MRTVGEVIKAVEDAGKVFAEADAAEKKTYEVRQKALEAYNVVMKELDMTVAEMKKGAPAGTPWHDGKR